MYYKNKGKKNMKTMTLYAQHNLRPFSRYTIFTYADTLGPSKNPSNVIIHSGVKHEK